MQLVRIQQSSVLIENSEISLKQFFLKIFLINFVDDTSLKPDKINKILN